MNRSTRVLVMAAIAVARARAGHAQSPPSPTDQSARVIVGKEYDAGSLRRTLFGEGWRDVWTKPVVAPVFDMGRFAGGVTPTERGGGNQTISLRFREVNGWREYQFRSVNKDPVSLAMPKAIRGTMLGVIAATRLRRRATGTVVGSGVMATAIRYLASIPATTAFRRFRSRPLRQRRYAAIEPKATVRRPAETKRERPASGSLETDRTRRTAA